MDDNPKKKKPKKQSNIYKCIVCNFSASKKGNFNKHIFDT